MLLIIDAGNTRTKWAVFNKDGISTHEGVCPNADVAAIDWSPTALHYQRIVISNVAGPAHASLLEQKLAAYQLPMRWVKASALACGLHNGYSTPQALGTDRWAALIAAFHLKHSDCIVVNAGTALTIDALSMDALQVNSSNQQANFIGGMILPGLNLMQQSLGLATAQLPLATEAIPAPATTTATSTAAAIYAGALYAIVGAITMMQQSLLPATPCIIISGGNAQLIHDALLARPGLNTQPDLLENQVLIVDNLVLQGLFLLEKLMPEASIQSEPT